MSKTVLNTKREQEACPACGAGLVIRSGKHGPFLGCPNYPDCDYIRPLKSHGESHIVKVLDGYLCPECGADKVLRQGRYGMFVSCSHYPECHYSEAIDKPDHTAIDCPLCGEGKLVQRRSRYGKTFHACDRYPSCQFAVNATPVAGECLHCHFPLLIEKKTAQGVKRFCASKRCGKVVAPEN